MQPWPGAFTQWQGKLLKVTAARSLMAAEVYPGSVVATAGVIANIGKTVGVNCGDGSVLELVTLQPEGRKPMPAADFARGAAGFIGSHL